MFYSSVEELYEDLKDVLELKDDDVEIKDPRELRGVAIEKLAANAAAADDPEVKRTAQFLIRRCARIEGIEPASIHDLYIAVGEGKMEGNYTVPACNLRTLTFESARAIFRTAKMMDAGAFIFEIAKSEMGYTDQRPDEYVSQILAAAIRELWKGYVFIQGDHFQINAKNFAEDPEKEKAGLKTLIREAMAAGFYNIDIDSSTIVDLSKPTLEEQQRLNAQVCAEMTAFIRELEPRKVTVSIGGEIGEVGEKNSTPEEFRAFMKEYNEALSKYGDDIIGISKISIQTGTSHGGTVLPDGSIKEVSIDLDALRNISELSRKEYGLGGAVQHGASTLDEEAWSQFVENKAIEVHLATAFQNLVFDSENLPSELRDRMYKWVDENCAHDRKPDQTDEQFYYNLRKKALGPFKKELISLDQEIRFAIGMELQTKFRKNFKALNIKGSNVEVKNSIKFVKVPWDAVEAGDDRLHIGADEPGE